MARQVEGPWFRKAKGTWYATVGGKSVSLGVKGKQNRAAAREAWHKLMAGGPAPTHAPEPTVPTVRAVVDGFLADVGGRAKPKTVEVYRYLLTPFAERFGGRPGPAIRPHDAEAFARRPSWSSSTRNDFLAALVTAFRWAVRAGLLADNPLTSVRKPPKTSRGTAAVVSEGEFARLHTAASESFKPLLKGLWLTGCRPGELARLTAADVNYEAGVALLIDHKTAGATGRPRCIYLSPEAVVLFRQQAERHPTGPLFRNERGGAWTGWAIVKAMAAAREKAGLAKVVAYGLRHSFATDALVKGVPDATVAALLGHTNTAMLHRHYSHLSGRAGVLRQAVSQVR